MKTALEVIAEIKSLTIEIDKLEFKHGQLQTVDDSEEWEQTSLDINIKTARLDALIWLFA